MGGRIGMVAAAVALAFVLPCQAEAQVTLHLSSLEWMVEEAAVVVRGKVVGVTRSEPGILSVWKTVTIEAVEVLKGESHKSYTFAVSTLDSDRIFEGWHNAECEALWFLSPNFMHGRARDAAHPWQAEFPLMLSFECGGVIRLGPEVDEEQGFSPRCPPVFTRNFEVLEDPRQIVAEAKKAAAEARERKPVQGHEFRIPHAIMKRCTAPADANFLTVPRDGHLEKLALRMIQEPQLIMPEAEARATKIPVERATAAAIAKMQADMLRIEGIKALKHFQRGDYATLLKPMLADTTVWMTTSPSGKRYREYPLRHEAYKVLRSWKVDVPAPVWREWVEEPLRQ